MADFPPQLTTESAKAYEAFCLYCEMGAGRGVRAVSQKLDKSRTIIGRWSSQHQWVERVRVYDASMAADVAAEHTKRYLADLEDHRKRYARAGQLLYHLSTKVLAELSKQVETLDITPNTLATVSKAFTTAADLEAHALGIDQLLPRLEKGNDDDGL